MEGFLQKKVYVEKQAIKTPEVLQTEEEETEKHKIDNEKKYLDVDDIRKKLPKYFKLLNLDPDDADNMNLKKINEAYERVASKHIILGGDVKAFVAMDRANQCLAHFIKIEAKYEYIEFDCVIKKGPPGEGLGISIEEFRKQKVVQIIEVMDCIKILNIDANSGGTLEPKDTLIGIGNDIVLGWPLRRIVARVSNFRCPSGAPVKLRFRRRQVRKEIEKDFGQQEEGYASPTESEVSITRSNVQDHKDKKEGDIRYLDARPPSPQSVHSNPTPMMNEIQKQQRQQKSCWKALNKAFRRGFKNISICFSRKKKSQKSRKVKDVLIPFDQALVSKTEEESMVIVKEEIDIAVPVVEVEAPSIDLPAVKIGAAASPQACITSAIVCMPKKEETNLVFSIVSKTCNGLKDTWYLKKKNMLEVQIKRLEKNYRILNLTGRHNAVPAVGLAEAKRKLLRRYYILTGVWLMPSLFS